MQAGDKVPAFKLEGSDGKTHTLKDFKGSPWVIYFYPRDNTPGCTKESCGFSEALAAFKKAGATVVGVSPDTVKSHEGFVAKYALKHLLLSDPDKDLALAFGVYREKTLYGRKSLGIVRSTYVVDAQGVVAKAFENVRVDGHVEKVLTALKELS